MSAADAATIAKTSRHMPWHVRVILALVFAYGMTVQMYPPTFGLEFHMMPGNDTYLVVVATSISCIAYIIGACALACMTYASARYARQQTVSL